MGVRSVLILRPDNLGDVVLFTGALRHVRARFPGAEITLCVRRYVRDLVALSPHVDRVVAWEDLHEPLLDGLPRFRGRGRLDRALRLARLRLRWAPDVLLLPVRSPTAEMHPVARAVRAGVRYGIAGDFSNLPEAESRRAEGIYDHLLRLGPERYGDHDFAVTRDFLRMLGIEVSADEVRPELWTDAADRAWAEAAVPRAEGAPTLGIAPGVTAPRGKLYPLEQLARALEMAGDARLPVVLFGSASEAGICAELGRLLAGSPAVASVTDLSGRSTLRQMVEGIRRCDAFLAPDAAALHVAVALGKPTVGILGGGHYGRFHPWGDPVLNRICSVPMECYGCNWTCRFATTRCVLEVTPEQVAGALRDVLALAGRGAALHTPA